MSALVPQPACSPATLIWLVRGTGALIAVPAGLMALFALLGMPILMLTNSHRPALNDWTLLLAIALMLTFVLFYGVIAKVGYDMYRKLNATTVANFAFIFSFLSAYVIYHDLPLILPKLVAAHYCGGLALLVFIVFYCVIKNYVLQILELNAPDSPPPPDTDPDVPEFPQKSPLRPL